MNQIKTIAKLMSAISARLFTCPSQKLHPASYFNS
jgi:hypothetical protein